MEDDNKPDNTLYDDVFRGHHYRLTPIGCHKPKWLRESFSLERHVREEWWDVGAGDVVLDVGAGFGSYTLSALAAGAAQVIAIEPAKEELFSLTQNLALNPAFLARCIAVPLVLSDLHHALIGFSAHMHTCIQTNTTHEERISETADSLLDSLGVRRLDWLKVDVEGMEAFVLRGAQRILADLRPRVIVEVHTAINPDLPLEIDGIMRTYGYAAQRKRGDGVNDNWELWTPE